MTLIVNLQNLQQENGTLLMTKIMDNTEEEMKVIQPLNLRQKLLNQFRDYSDAYVLVRGDIAAVGGNANTNVAFKNCTRFTRFVIHK